MKFRLKKLLAGLVWFYVIILTLWWISHSWFGDSIWWLALLNSFVPYFFLPLVLLLPACLFYRSQLVWAGILPGLIFVSLYGELFFPKWVASSTREATAITLMTFNIWGGSHSTETAQVILENGKPDVVAVQELTPQMAEVLQQQLAGEYRYWALDSQPQHRGMGILSRFPITELDSRYLADPAWQIQIVAVKTAFGNFTLYNVHPHSTNILVYIEDGLPLRANVQASFEARKQLIELLIKDIHQRHGPVIVVGDFNSTDQSEVYQLLTEALTDAHHAVGWGFGHTFPAYAGNFRGFPIFPRQMRVDMIFYSDEFLALSSHVSSTYGESDHLPVLAQLAWKQ